MHPNSKFLFEQHALSYFDDCHDVLEIGPDASPSTYQQLVRHPDLRWTTIDLDYGDRTNGGRPFAHDASGVDHLVMGEYSFPFPDNTFDTVVSGQVLEHVRRIWEWFGEVARVCKPGGHVITVCPVSWPYHEAPVDCWRIYPEGMRALCDEAHLQVLFSTVDSLEPRVSRRSYPGPTHRWGQRLGVVSTGKDLLRRAVGWPTPFSLDTLTVAKKAEESGSTLRNDAGLRDEGATDSSIDRPPLALPLVDVREDRRDWRRFKNILACPHCNGHFLSEREDRLTCDDCSTDFSIIDGVPILVCGQDEARIVPATHTSNQAPMELLEWLESKRGFTLHLGGGATDVKPDNCIEVEYAVFRHTDVVSDAHHLPFGDGTISAVLSLNTFEHLRDPATAANELYRVLQPGGEIYVQTAFLQPLHEEPAHFFNASEFGLREWFSDFEVDFCSVPPNFSPAYSLAWLASEMLHAAGTELGPDIHERLESSTLGQWQHIWSAGAAAEHELSEIVGRLSDFSTRKLAAGFDLRARKPLSGIR